ncbi:DUF443 family protein [Staphylococcus caledonicus]|uniref:DUF443 family protein n=1 Tax=Staphylococcus caledonicus TaxID=2741333 RepID=UPI0018E460C8|nr:DUF443 family protein [Staphylococcus caledonicus]MBI5972870.1 DUF443 family protein [Staphylococcus caledonicus]
MREFIEKIKIETIEKNSKYKLVHYKNSHYIIDLNQNKLTYIFPLLNYATRKSLMEVQKEDLSYIKTIFTSKEKEEKRSSLTNFVAGLSFLVAILTRFILDSLNFTTNIYINIFLLLLTILPVCIFKYIVDKKKMVKLNIRLTEVQAHAFILPDIKYVFQNIFFYIIFVFLFSASIAGLLTLERTNIIFVIGITMTLIFILFQNVFLYAQTEIDGKIGGIKWKQ